MSKFTLFVGVYSAVMIALFFTFCFLMTGVNPPRVNPDSEHSRRFGVEELIYSDEFLPNDNVAYGLEKVDDNYESIDVFAKNKNQNLTSMTTISVQKNYKTNFTRKENIKTVTKSMKHIKALRRSINKEYQQNDTIPRSVHLKIKDLDGRPRIEIKVVPEKSKSKKIRTYRSSANITNNNQTLYNDNDNDMTEYVYNNITKEVSVVIGNNEKLVIDFARDSINLYDENTLDKDTNLLNDKNISETTYNNNNDLLSTSSIVDNVLRKVMMDKTESNQTIIERTIQIMRNSGKNETKSTETSFDSVCVDTKTKIEATKDSNETTKPHIPSDNGKTDETSGVVNIPANTLVGLLIPEATATLPFNYHFIN